MFYTAVWCTKNEIEFKKSVPLELLGASIQRYKSRIGFSIVVLEGMELLSGEYIHSLESYGFTVINYSREFKKIVCDYENINRHYNSYERNCFLRWIAFKQLHLNNLPFSQFWHLDSDIILHTSLEELAQDTSGKTFMLQGCPVLLTISDPHWFELYEQNLKALNKDITGYSMVAFENKKLCKQNDASLLNLSSFRNPIGSDQDLLEYLISAKKIIQDDKTTIYSSNFYFAENPLTMRFWHKEQCKDNSSFEINNNLEVTIGTKKVPFIHYQNYFALFAAMYLQFKDLYFPASLNKRILAYQIDEDKLHTTIVYKVIAKIKIKFDPGYSREQVIRKLLTRNNGTTLGEILNLLKP